MRSRRLLGRPTPLRFRRSPDYMSRRGLERRRSVQCGVRCEWKNCQRVGRNTSGSGCDLWRRSDLSLSGRSGLDVAEVGGLAERGERVAGGDEFVGDVAAEVGGGDAAHDAVPLDFLGAVEFVAAGNAAGVEVGDPIDVFLDGADQVTFHDLHVIDVVEELDARGVDGLDPVDAPGGVVADVVVVVELAVEELHADGDAVVFGDFFDAIEADDGVLGAFFVGHAAAISGERDDVGDAGFGGERNVFAEAFFNFGVIFGAVHGADNFASAGVTHAADQAIARGYIEFVGIQQVDGLQTDLGGVGTKLVERNLLVTPAGNGLADIAFALDRNAVL